MSSPASSPHPKRLSANRAASRSARAGAAASAAALRSTAGSDATLRSAGRALPRAAASAAPDVERRGGPAGGGGRFSDRPGGFSNDRLDVLGLAARLGDADLRA